MKAMRRLPILVAGLVAAAAVAGVVAERSARTPAPPAPVRVPANAASAVFAGGCFWSMEHAFDETPGVISTTSGFAGGRVANPTYERVIRGDTGHLESVRVVYDPARISYAALANRFFHSINPLDAGGQFCDQGPQYRTAIFVANPAERRAAEGVKAQVSRQLRAPVATRILPAGAFYPAEDYHQDFADRNPARYGAYRRGCGRDTALAHVWSRAR